MSASEENRSALLAAVLARALPDASPHLIARAVAAMQHAAKAHKRAAENACNYPMTEAQTARADKRCARLAETATHAADDAAMSARWPSMTSARACGVSLAFGGDPRGPCGWIKVSDMPGDGWGDGFAIYE